MKDKILNYVIKERKGHYCHALEVSSVDELEAVIEQLVDEFSRLEFSKKEIIDFFDTISLYSLDDDNEDEIYDFDITAKIKELF